MEKCLKSFKQKLPEGLNDFGITPVVVGVVLFVNAILQIVLLTKESLAVIDVEVDLSLLFDEVKIKSLISIETLVLPQIETQLSALVSSLLKVDISAFSGCIAANRCQCE